MTNTEKRRLTASPCVAAAELTQAYSYRRSAQPSFISRCLIKNEPIALYLTGFYLNKTFSK